MYMYLYTCIYIITYIYLYISNVYIYLYTYVSNYHEQEIHPQRNPLIPRRVGAFFSALFGASRPIDPNCNFRSDGQSPAMDFHGVNNLQTIWFFNIAMKKHTINTYKWRF